jgi:hypothetical protein
MNEEITFTTSDNSMKLLLSSLSMIQTSYNDVAHSFQIIKIDTPIPKLQIKSMKCIKNILPFPITIKSID